MKRILKWTVPVDDQPHEIGGGRIVHVASQYGRVDELQVWTEEVVDNPAAHQCVVKVFVTGHFFNDSGTAVATVIVSDGNLVWHLVKYS